MTTTDARPIGFYLVKLDALINGRFEATLGRRDVTRRQWQLLNTLVKAKTPATAEALNAAVAPFLAAGETVEPHLAPLAARREVRHDGDTYELTETGRALFETLRAEVEATREQLLTGLTADDYRRTIEVLDTMIRNLT